MKCIPDLYSTLAHRSYMSGGFMNPRTEKVYTRLAYHPNLLFTPKQAFVGLKKLCLARRPDIDQRANTIRDSRLLGAAVTPMR